MAAAADVRIARRLRRAVSRCSARFGFPWRFGIGAATSLQGLCKAEDAEAHCKMLYGISSHEEDMNGHGVSNYGLRSAIQQANAEGIAMRNCTIRKIELKRIACSRRARSSALSTN